MLAKFPSIVDRFSRIVVCTWKARELLYCQVQALTWGRTGSILLEKTEDMEENSLVVQWLELCTFTAGAQVQSLVGELRSHKPHNRAKLEKRNGNSLWAPEWEGDLEHHGPSMGSAK